MSTCAPSRRPAGSPAGGQFAPTSHPETAVELDSYRDAVFSGSEADDGFAGLTEAALWSSVDPDTMEPLDGLYTAADLDPETLTQMREEFDDFVHANNATIARIRAEHPDCTPAQVGHDFWLTRNRHGAGFWDRGYGEDGDVLSEAAKVYGTVDLYIGDDNRVRAF